MAEFCPPMTRQPTFHTTDETMSLQLPENHSPYLRIINGTGAERKDYPYAATFTTDPSPTGDPPIFSRGRKAHGGATLISRRHLITTAHVVSQVADLQLAP